MGLCRCLRLIVGQCARDSLFAYPCARLAFLLSVFGIHILVSVFLVRAKMSFLINDLWSEHSTEEKQLSRRNGKEKRKWEGYKAKRIEGQSSSTNKHAKERKGKIFFSMSVCAVLLWTLGWAKLRRIFWRMKNLFKFPVFLLACC